MYKLGIDLGGTKIEGVALDGSHAELRRERIPTEQESGYRHILNNIKNLYERLVAAVEHQEHRFGICTPGAISLRTGLLKNSNTQCLNGQPFKQDLEKLLQRKIAIQNDANCFAMSEALKGAAVGKDLVFGVIMGTGCGGGIVYQGRVLSGLQGISGEWGHSSIDPKGPACWCGRNGCVEQFISGGGLEKMYENQFSQKCRFMGIIDDYRKGHSPAREFVPTFFVNFGRALANVINILDPDMVVLGGGLSNVEELYSHGVREVEKRVFSDSFETAIVKNQLGDSAGVIGAALIGC